MIIPDVSIDTWRRLYPAAEKLRKLEPWNFLFDDDLFAVREPATGLTYYCSVLGALGEVFALCAYRGGEGYDSWERMHFGDEDDDCYGDVFISQNLLMVEFVNRRELEKPDIEIIKNLALKIKGKNAHPCFRSMIPGCPPWHVDESEAQALISILHCASLFAVERKKNPEKVEKNKDGLLTYLPRVDIAEDSAVPTIFEKPETKKEKAPPKIIEVDPFTLKALKDAKSGMGLVWEVDAFFNLGMTVGDRDRPYWPRMVVVADHASGFLFNLQMVGPEANTCEAIARILFETIKKHGQKPSELHIRDADLSKALDPIAAKLDISVKVKKRLPAVLMVKDHLSRNFHP